MKSDDRLLLGALVTTGLLVLLAGIAVVVTAQEPAPADGDPLAALNEGNRLFRNGQYEAAVAAYEVGISAGKPHRTLAYNLGTALHHLDRLPEAILWYRRAGDSEDPWLAENLWLARRSLGSQVLEPGGLAGMLAGNAAVPRWIAVVLAWAGLGLVVVRRRWWWPAAAFAAALLCYGAAIGVETWGPRPAVLLAACKTAAGELPAGTEAWVRPLADDTFQVAGSELVCPAAAVGLVDAD